MTVEKPKPKQLLRPITTGANSAMNQSQFPAITCNSLKAREKWRVHGAIGFGFGFASYWLKNWRESLKPITERSDRNHVITFDNHLKTALTVDNNPSGTRWSIYVILFFPWLVCLCSSRLIILIILITNCLGFRSPERFCNNPVGLQNNRIKNPAITASSYLSNTYAPRFARLHGVRSWISKHNNHNQWVQVDLGRAMKITGIATQGRQDAAQWTTAYYVKFSMDGIYFAIVRHWWNAVKVNL